MGWVVPAPGVKLLPLFDALQVRSVVIERVRLEALSIYSKARGTLWRDVLPQIIADGIVDLSTSVVLDSHAGREAVVDVIIPLLAALATIFGEA